MANIRRRGKRYAVSIRRKGHKDIYKTFQNLRDAQSWATQTQADMERGEFRRGSELTLKSVIDDFTSEKELSTAQRSVLGWWKDVVGYRALGTLRRSDFAQSRRTLQKEETKFKKPPTPATINRRLSAISAVLTWCMEQDLIDSNPARIRRLPENNARERLLTNAERKSLIMACSESEEPALLPLVATAMVSGCRAGELQNLLWKDVDIKGGVARILNSKNKTRRPVPIRGFALDLIKSRRKEQPAAIQGHVFCHKDGRAPFNYRASWERAVKSAGIDSVRFHDLRHLTASELAMGGASLSEIAAVLGHKTLAMVQRYSHFMDKHLADLGDDLANRVFPK